LPAGIPGSIPDQRSSRVARGERPAHRSAFSFSPRGSHAGRSGAVGATTRRAGGQARCGRRPVPAGDGVGRGKTDREKKKNGMIKS